MAEVKWIKLSVNMFEDEKIRLIEALPEADTILIIWVKLLAQAGKTNASGYIYLSEHIPYTDEMLATIFNRPIGTVRLALKTFEQFGMLEISNDQFISITNWEKHQNVDGLEKIRQQTKKRVAEHRQKKKAEKLETDCNVTVTQGNATEEDIDIDKELDKDSIVDDEGATEVALIQKYMQLGVIPGFDISETEKLSVRQVISEGVPRDEALYYLEECFKNYKPKHVRDKISSFNYCATYILNRYFERKEAEDAKTSKKHTRRTGRTTAKNQESITGGKIGRL